MITVAVKHHAAACIVPELLTEGSVGRRCAFEFLSDEWKGLTKVAVFTNGSGETAVLLTGESCGIPAEVLSDRHRKVKVWVYGQDAAEQVLITTSMADLGTVLGPKVPLPEAAISPTPELWQQALDAAVRALQTADSLTKRAEAGEFAGERGPAGPLGPMGPAGFTPVKGVDYCTAEDEAELVAAVLAAIPAAEGGMF